MDWAYNADAVLVPLDTLAASLRSHCSHKEENAAGALLCLETATQTLLTVEGDNRGYCAAHAEGALSAYIG